MKTLFQIFWVLLAIVAGIATTNWITNTRAYKINVGDIPIYPCDIYGTDDWCQVYIDYGYANGAVMAQRILGENEFTNDDPTMTCEGVVQRLYDQNVDKTGEKFPTRIIKK